MRPAAAVAAVLFAAATAACGHGRLKPQKGEAGEVIEAEGWVPNDPADPAGTKARALAAAQRKAVERVVGVFISAKTRVDQAVHVDQRIMAKVEGYIRKYDVLSEKVEGGMFKTNIRALVLYQKVGDDLKELGLVRPPAPPGNPKVAVALKGRGTMADADVARASLGVRKALTEKGFTVVDRQADDPALNRPGTADVLVTGEADAFPIEDARLAGFRSYRARVTLQGTKAGSGQVLSQKSQEASGLDPAAEVARAKALETAGSMAGDALAGELGAALKTRIGVTVRIHGLKGLERVSQVADDIRMNPGVAAVTLGSFIDGKAELDVTTDEIAGEELAALILRNQKNRFTAKSVTPYEVELEGQ